MEEQSRYTLTKQERLCSKRILEHLFDGKNHSFSVYPLRVVFGIVEDEMLSSPVTVLFSVPKRRFKRAVKRNRVKRQLRESYRMNKSLLWKDAILVPDRKIVVAFLWLSDRLYESEKINGVMKTLLSRISEKLLTPTRNDIS